MGSYFECPICRKLDWKQMHKCKPLFFVRLDDYEPEDAVRIFADDVEEAAEQYYQNCFADNDYITDVTVIVRDDKNSWRVNVNVISEPVFNATVEVRIYERNHTNQNKKD